MSVVFDYLQRRLAEQGASYWKTTPFDIRLVYKTGDIDNGALDYTQTNLTEVTGDGYGKKVSVNNVVYETEGKIVYTFDDVNWVKSSVSADGILVSTGLYPLIFVDFGYRRLSENDDFIVQWGDNGLLYLETSGVSDLGGVTTPETVSGGIDIGNNLGNGEPIYVGVNNHVINFKTITSDNWVVLGSTGNELKLSMNQDFVRQGSNVEIIKNEDGSVTINGKDPIVPDVTKKIRDDLYGHIENETIHVTQDDKDIWNEHVDNDVIHVTQEDKDKWNNPDVDVYWDEILETPTTIEGYGITNVYTKTEVDNHTTNSSIHVSPEDRDRWDNPDTVTTWDELQGKPTTVAGFGITDVYTKTEVDDLIQAEGMDGYVKKVTEETQILETTLDITSLQGKSLLFRDDNGVLIGSIGSVSGYGGTNSEGIEFVNGTEVISITESYDDYGQNLGPTLFIGNRNSHNVWINKKGYNHQSDKYIGNIYAYDPISSRSGNIYTNVEPINNNFQYWISFPRIFGGFRDNPGAGAVFVLYGGGGESRLIFNAIEKCLFLYNAPIFTNTGMYGGGVSNKAYGIRVYTPSVGSDRISFMNNEEQLGFVQDWTGIRVLSLQSNDGTQYTQMYCDTRVRDDNRYFYGLTNGGNSQIDITTRGMRFQALEGGLNYQSYWNCLSNSQWQFFNEIKNGSNASSIVQMYATSGSGDANQQVFWMRSDNNNYRFFVKSGDNPNGEILFNGKNSSLQFRDYGGFLELKSKTSGSGTFRVQLSDHVFGSHVALNETVLKLWNTAITANRLIGVNSAKTVITSDVTINDDGTTDLVKKEDITRYEYFAGLIGDTEVTISHPFGTVNIDVTFYDMVTGREIVLVCDVFDTHIFVEDLSPLTMNNQIRAVLWKILIE